MELKFIVDSLNDWFTNVIKPKFLELSDVKKQIFIKENKIIPSKTTCCICGFLLDVEVEGEHKRWYNFEVEREHLFLRNIFTPNELKEMRIDNTEEYIQIIDRLLEFFPEIENAPDTGGMSEEFKNFLLEDFNNQYSTLREIKDDINHIVLPKKLFFENKFDFSDKIICFIYSTLMKFVRTNKVKGVPLSKTFIENLKGIIKNKVHVHHSHVTDEVISYTHSYCNLKVRENKSKTTVVVHNFFKFDFFFLVKRLRAGVWRTRDIKISGKNPANISFANIDNQIMFLDTIKYFQQSLGSIAASMTDNEKLAIRRECEKFIKKDPNFALNFNLCSDEEKDWVLNYLSTGKGTIPYEMITGFDSLNIEPEGGNFFLPHHFYSSLKDDVMTDEE